MSNPTRTCIGCAATDDHPRHVLALPDGSEVGFHMDCHVIATNCEVCSAQLAGAKGAKGDKLRAHLLTTGDEAGKPGWTAPDADLSGKKEAA